MQRNPLSRRSVLSLAGGCALAGAGMAAVGGAQEQDRADGLTRESFVVREGTDEETTVYVTTADADGPTAVVVGGVHGNEVAGYTAAGAVADWEIGAGTLVTIPEANAVAIERGTRTDDDGVDLNRQFPEGSDPTTDLARALWDVLVEYEPDVVIDLHESTGVYANDPVDGVGQAIFRSDGAAAAAANDAARYVTRNYVDDPDLAFQTGPFTGPNTDPRGLLVHKATRDLGAEAFLAETLSTDVSLETRVQWHSAIVERLLTDELRLDATGDESVPDEEDEPDADDDEPEPDEDDGADGEGTDETDDGESGDPDSPVAVIDICPGNAAETALEPGRTVELDASGSCARGGEIVRYEWDVGQTAQFDETGETIDVTVGANGRDTVVLRVVDDEGATDTESITLAAN